MLQLKQQITTIIFLVLLLFFSSCSTKKKSWVNRQYHNVSAKYNGYFNGNESLKSGILKIRKNHKDDYTTILNVFPETKLEESKKTQPYMDKAIQKGSIVIQRHSMKIGGKEYCKWIDDNYLMIGKAYFYKGNFDEAVKTFSFIKNEYNSEEIKLLASLWLFRSYVEKQDFSSAKKELEELGSHKKMSKKIKLMLAKTSADYYLRSKNFSSAKVELIKSIELTNGKRNRVRLNYILAQIYQLENKDAEAKKYYQTVLKSNPEYEMAFNAKMNIARTLDKGDEGFAKMKEELLKMTKDEKNTEYLDQIYYTIAKLEINNEDTVSALNSYSLSSLYSLENNIQKSLSFLAAAEIKFHQKKYYNSQSLYDSTILYMDEKHRLYEETKEKQIVLNELVLNLKTVELQDSLQNLSKLSTEEQKKVVQQIIQNIIAQENIIAEEKRLKQQAQYENSLTNGRNNQFGVNTSGGKWYFYNPATLSFGLSEFRKKWGSRKLEDDWRRKDKKNISNNQDTTIKDTVSTETQNTKDPQYYLSQIPKTQQELLESDQKIKEALYNLGVLYIQKLNESKLSTKSFLETFDRYPKDKEYTPLCLYSAYKNHKKPKEKENIKKVLLNRFPNSVYSKMLLDSNYSEQAQESNETLKYIEVLGLYKQKKHNQILSKTTTLKDNSYKSKLLLIRALSQISLNKKEDALITLNKINQEDQEVFQQASHLIGSINDPTRIQEANEMATTGSAYLYRKNIEHMVVLVLPKNGVDMTYLKTLISDFHIKSVGNELFEVSSLLLGLDHHLVIIKSFQNAYESMEYRNLFLSEQTLTNEINKAEHSVFSISLENFRRFYNTKDIVGYNRFYTTNYTN
tara:strand:+ start:9882 stop:12440 length:2559 start_codon:yes stop_codon:yes gene_type:complete